MPADVGDLGGPERHDRPQPDVVAVEGDVERADGHARPPRTTRSRRPGVARARRRGCRARRARRWSAPWLRSTISCAMRVSARRRSAASNTLRAQDDRRRPRRPETRNDPRHSGQGRQCRTSRISPRLSCACMLSPPWRPHGIPFTVRARIAPRRRRHAADGGAPVEPRIRRRRACRRPCAGASSSKCSASASRVLARRLRRRPRPARLADRSAPGGAARRAAQLERRRAPATARPGDRRREPRPRPAPARRRCRPNSTAWCRAVSQPRTARASRRRRAGPTRSGRTPASRRRGSRSPPTRARRARAPTNWPVSASRVPGTKPVASRAGIPTLRAITTRLLATCSHQPSRERNRKSSTTSTPRGRERRVRSSTSCARPSTLRSRGSCRRWSARRRGDLARERAHPRRRGRLLRRTARAPRREPAARRRHAGCSPVESRLRLSPCRSRRCRSPRRRLARAVGALLRRAVSVSTETGLGAANTTSEKPLSRWKVWRIGGPVKAPTSSASGRITLVSPTCGTDVRRSDSDCVHVVTVPHVEGLAPPELGRAARRP